MKLFLNKAPSPGLRPTSPPKGEVSLRDVGGTTSPLPGGRGRRGAAGKGAFSEQNCAIWNDIRRALEGEKK